MKHSIILLTVLIFPLFVFSQDTIQNNNLEYYQHRFEHFDQMKRNGNVLIGVGSVASVAGMTIYLKNWSLYSYNDEEEAGKMITAVILMVIGEAALAGGITMSAIGKAKSDQYRRLIETDKNTLSLHMTNNGLTLRFRF